MNIRFTLILTLMLTSITTLAAPAHAQDTRKQIEARLEGRYPQLLKLIKKGQVGETWQGFLEPVKEQNGLDDQTQSLIKDENADRKKLYQLIADKQTPADMVGQANARRKFQKADPDDHIKVKEGLWIQLKEVGIYKKEGKIGETWEGYVDFVKAEYRDEEQIAAVVAEENRIRKDNYDRRAKKENKSVKQIAEEAGTKNISQAAAGEYAKAKDGEWKKR